MKNIMLLIILFFFSFYAIVGLAEKLPLSLKVEAEQLLVKKGIKLQDVRLLGIVKDNINPNTTTVEFEALHKINIYETQIPAKAIVKVNKDAIISITSIQPFTVKNLQCSGYAEFKNNTICNCSLAQDAEIESIKMPRESRIYFNQGRLIFFELSKSGKKDTQKISSGAYKIKEQGVIEKIPKKMIEFLNVCQEGPSKKLLEEADKSLKKINVETSAVKIVFVEVSELEETLPDGVNIFFVVLKPMLIQGYKLSAGAEVHLVNQHIFSIRLPEGEHIKLNGFLCINNVEFDSDKKLCSCPIESPVTINKYTIKPPATLYFRKGKFMYFLSSDEENKKIRGGYYEISSSGVPRLNEDVELYRCY